MGAEFDIAAVVAPNGAGHLRRVFTVLRRVHSHEPGIRTWVGCSSEQRMLLRRIAGSLEPLFTLGDSPFQRKGSSMLSSPPADSEVKRWEEGLMASAEVGGARLVVSDNIGLTLTARPDAVLMGSFLWSEVFADAATANGYVQRERSLLDRHRPPMVCVGDMATPSVLEWTYAVRVGWMCERPEPAFGSVQSAPTVALLGGRTERLDCYLAGLAEHLTRSGGVLVRAPESLQTGRPAAAPGPFDFSPQSYSRLGVVVCRPGMGTLTDSVSAAVPVVALYEAGSSELAHNGARVQTLGIGLDLGVEPPYAEVVKAVEALLGPHGDACRKRIAELNRKGVDEAARWLLHRLSADKERGA